MWGADLSGAFELLEGLGEPYLKFMAPNSQPVTSATRVRLVLSHQPCGNGFEFCQLRHLLTLPYKSTLQPSDTLHGFIHELLSSPTANFGI